MAIQQYLLRSHVYACKAGDGTYFLDTRRGTYFTLRAAQLAAVTPLIKGWSHNSDTAAAPNQAADTDIADLLVDKQVLTIDASVGNHAPHIEIPRTSTMAFRDLDEPAPTITLRHLAAVIFSCVRAKLALRFESLEMIVRRVRNRKYAGERTEGSRESSVHNLTAIFHRHRGLVYTAKNHCLLDSLALVEFLALYRLYPTWVIGVQPRPFAAHSWVQYSGCILNDTLELVQDYAPILAV